MKYLQKNTLAEAIWTSNLAFDGVLDKQGRPYIYHPMRLAEMASRLGLDEESQIIAILHDNVEDTDQTLEYLASKFSERVVDGVDAMTRRNSCNIKEHFDHDCPLHESYFDFVRRAATNSDARKIKMLDNADNMRPDRAVEGLKLGKRYKKSIGILKEACKFFHEDEYVKKFEELVTWV